MLAKKSYKKNSAGLQKNFKAVQLRVQQHDELKRKSRAIGVSIADLVAIGLCNGGILSKQQLSLTQLALLQQLLEKYHEPDTDIET